MGQRVDVSPQGRIVVEHGAGHLFEFQVYIRGTGAICMTNITWGVGGSTAGLDSLGGARVLAEQAAIRRGWLRSPVRWAGI